MVDTGANGGALVVSVCPKAAACVTAPYSLHVESNIESSAAPLPTVGSVKTAATSTASVHASVAEQALAARAAEFAAPGATREPVQATATVPVAAVVATAASIHASAAEKAVAPILAITPKSSATGPISKDTRP